MRFKPLAVIALGAIAGTASAVQFTITVTNIGVQPIAPVFYATSNASFDIFDNGSAASADVELMAEEGDTSMLVAAAGAAGADVMSFGTTTGPFMMGESRTFTVDADLAHPWFQFAAMLGATNDGFIGSAVGLGDGQINLFQNGNPLTGAFTLSFLNVWDAGTEVNTELQAHIPAFGNIGVGPTEGGVITQPHIGITGIGDVPQSFNWYGGNVAQITITPVPEPGTMAALGFGGLALLMRKRRKA